MIAMRNFQRIEIFLCVFVLTLLLVFSIPALSGISYANNSTYYVDSVSGLDTNDGLSTGAPWQSLTKINSTTFQPGDRILFKSGSTWTGQLHPLGSGAAGSPIIIDKYGTGSKPTINGGGLPGGLATGGTIYLYNQQYWEIRNLEVTNYSTTLAQRYGVRVEAHDVGAYNHIYIEDLYIHDISSVNTDDGMKTTGGIFVTVTGSAVKTNWDDVRIDGNKLERTDRTGISTASSWGTNNGSSNFVPYTNLVISNNTIDDVGGDGIVMRSALNGIVENNVVSRARQRNYGSDVAIWAKDSINPIMQYNEAYLTKGTSDAQGFDCDYNITGCTVQYNYSHNNEGGFLLMMTNGDIHNDNAVVRYNISQNDRTRIIEFHGSPGPIPSNFQVYNNTFYVGAGLNTAIVQNDSTGTQASNMIWKNNIVVNLGSGGYSPIGIYDYNLFYGNHPASEPNDAHKLTSDPLFAAPGTGGNGRGTVDGYKLQVGSPAIGSGVVISNNGGKDYWNNSVSATATPHRGAYNGPGVTLVPTPGTVILDNNASSGVTVNGTWVTSSSSSDRIGADYLHDNNLTSNGMYVQYNPTLDTSGLYDVYVYYSAAASRATNTPIDVSYNAGSTTITLDQTTNGATWYKLGTWNFTAGSTGFVKIRNDNANGYVIADAVKFVAVNDTVILDNDAPSGVTQTAGWVTSSTFPERIGATYLHDNNSTSNGLYVQYNPTLSLSGTYDVYIFYSAASSRATNTPVDVNYNGGLTTVTVNQTLNGGVWYKLGTWGFASGASGYVKIRNDNANGYVMADAVKFVKQ